MRWCLFVEPVQVYRGRKARLEAVLANEDVLAPGDYPVRLQVVGPRGVSVFDRTITVKIPDPNGKPEPPFALPVFAEDVVIDGPSGKYRFLATFQKGGAAAGGDVEFYVADPADMPKVETEVVLWGDDADLAKWLERARHQDTAVRRPESQNSREVILVGNRPAAGDAEAFRELARHIARGSSAVFLSPEVFKKGDNRTRLAAAGQQGQPGRSCRIWVYHKDDWAKNHPIFEGLPAGCILDHTFYREIMLPSHRLVRPGRSGRGGCRLDQHRPAATASGLTIGVWNLGAGRFTLNTLRIRENLGSDPVAERLLRNMLRHAARDCGKPLAELPADFDAQLKALGYDPKP